MASHLDFIAALTLLQAYAVGSFGTDVALFASYGYGVCFHCLRELFLLYWKRQAVSHEPNPAATH